MEPVRRRRRPAVACTLCRRRKIRCDRETPCSNCVRSKSDGCTYDNASSALHKPQSRGAIDHDGASSISTTSTSPSDVESMKGRIKELEGQLQRAKMQTSPPTSAALELVPIPDSNIEAAVSSLGGTYFIHHGNPALGQPRGMNRSVTHKKRMFGQSHWMNYGIVLVKDIAEMIDEHARSAITEEAQKQTASMFTGMQQCKRLARLIKAQRTPIWPCVPTSDLPSKDIADELVDCYLRTMESVYRILHVPSFRRDYETLWVSDSEPDNTFLVQLKLVLAIGATTYNDTFILRSSAIRWVYEAESWLSNPTLKHRLGLQYLQVYCLLLIAREMVAVGEDLVWLSAGALLRASIHMGLHRDPAYLPSRTIFANEMHRRLWNTILELSLQASLNSGGPPLISLGDYDTCAPNNFDDEQLTNEEAVPKTEENFTQVSVAIALRKTFPARLAIGKFLNDFASSGSFEDTLSLDADFRTSYKSMRRILNTFDSGAMLSSTQFEVRFVDMIMYRYLLALHMPFFSSAMHESAYAFSRKVVVDAALKMWYALVEQSDLTVDPLSDTTRPSRNDSLERLAACGSGFLRTAALQAFLVISVELRAQLKEDDGLGPMPLRRDLLAIVEDGKRWQLWCVEAGETNSKGVLFAHLISAHIDGLLKGRRRDEIPGLIVKAADQAQKKSLIILQAMLEQGMPEQAVKGLNQMSLNPNAGILEGWDFMMPDIALDTNVVDPMSWMYDDSNTQMGFIW